MGLAHGAGAPGGLRKWAAAVRPAGPLSTGSGQSKGWVAAPSGGEEPACLVTARTQMTVLQ